MKKFLIFSSLIYSIASNAGLINLNFDQNACVTALNNPTPNPAASSICTQVEQGLDVAINQDFPDTDFSGFAQDTSDSLATSSVGISDYSDNFTYFVLKPSAGFAITAPDTSADTTSLGAGFSGSLMIGINLRAFGGGNLGFIDLSRTDLFLNYFGFGLNQNFGNGTFSGNTNALGVFARYLLVSGGGYDSALEWGGIYLHTGVQKSQSRLSFSMPIDIDAGVTVEGETGNIQNANFSFELDSSITSIPIEISTYLNILYAFTVYGGLGFDIHSGNTEMNFISKGDLVLESRNNADLGDIGYNNLNSASPQSGKMRAFAGAQFNLPYFRIYGQVQTPMGSNTVAFAGGLKLVW